MWCDLLWCCYLLFLLHASQSLSPCRWSLLCIHKYHQHQPGLWCLQGLVSFCTGQAQHRFQTWWICLSIVLYFLPSYPQLVYFYGIFPYNSHLCEPWWEFNEWFSSQNLLPFCLWWKFPQIKTLHINWSLHIWIIHTSSRFCKTPKFSTKRHKTKWSQTPRPLLQSKSREGLFCKCPWGVIVRLISRF